MIEYPYTGVSMTTGIEILFISSYTGICTFVPKKYAGCHKVGEHSTDWFESNFKRKEEIEMKKGVFIIGGIQSDGTCSISTKPSTHANIFSAQNEAERLAKTTPGKKFMVLEVKGIVGIQQVYWE